MMIVDIEPEIDNLGMWYVDDIDSDKMNINYKYNKETDKNKINSKENRKPNIRDGEDKNSEKKDKASPSNN